MEKEIAVSNSSSLIYIAKLNLFSLVKNMFREILIPEQVIEEIFKIESSENNLIEKELGSFLKKVTVNKIKRLPLGEGERSAISYCIENKISVFLSDDKKARNFALPFGLKAIGVIGIVLSNLQDKIIKKEEARKLIEKLIDKGYYMSSELYKAVIEEIES